MKLADLRRYAISRSLFPPAALDHAVAALGYVQADPIRAPARAQDLILRHRVQNFRAGDLERAYPSLAIEEEYFINYGYVTRAISNLMHPRSSLPPWSRTQKKRAASLLEFVRERGTVHPRQVDEHFQHGNTTNYWGGSSRATTHLLDAMHYRGLLRVAGRAAGIRIYAAREQPEPPAAGKIDARLDALIDAVVAEYAPLPAASLSALISRLRVCVPQWHTRLRHSLRRTRERLSLARLDGIDWYWPAAEETSGHAADTSLRLLAPFDPIVWDRRRFELLWGWAYRFEAYTPAAKRKLGYYALPLLWRDHVIGWANVTCADGRLAADFGFVKGAPPALRSYARELEAELLRLQTFLGLGEPAG